MEGNENNRLHPLTLDQGCFHTHRKLENSHFLSTGSSPPEKTIRVKKKSRSRDFGSSKKIPGFCTTPYGPWEISCGASCHIELKEVPINSQHRRIYPSPFGWLPLMRSVKKNICNQTSECRLAAYDQDLKDI